jgi:hypothetical protein
MVNRLEKAYPFIDLRNGIANDVNAYWNVGELLAVEMDLQRLDSAATTDLNQIFSPQEIKMVRLHANSLKAGQDSCGEFTTGNKTVQKGIYITDHYINDRQMCDGTIEHELAHWWDRKYDVSSDFQEYTGGFTLLWFLYFPGPGKTPLNLAAGSFNRKEDFAGSFEEYIILSKGGIESTGIEVGEKRWLFIDTLLRTGTSPSQTSQVSPLPYCWTWMPYDM